MGKYAQLVIGPAGCGKSTYCYYMHQHCEAMNRRVNIVNLDPAAETFHYPVTLDVRELITLEDVMEELQLGPNGALVYCMEYLESNMNEWLSEELASFIDEDYLIFDCPGQIELYSHIPVFKSFVDYLKNDGWQVCAVYCIDCNFMGDSTKFLGGTFQALSAMVALEVPHVNLMTKIDLWEGTEEDLEQLLQPDRYTLLRDLNESLGEKYIKLNQAVASLTDQFDLVGFLPLNVKEEDSIQDVLSQIDMAIQFGEDADVKVKDYEENERDEPQEDQDHLLQNYIN